MRRPEGTDRPAPVPTPRPYGSYFDEVVDALEAAYPAFSDAILAVVVAHDELTLHVDPARIREVCQTMRDEPSLRFEALSSLSAVDYLGFGGSEAIGEDHPQRFHVCYHLLSMTYRRRVRLEAAVGTPDMAGQHESADPAGRPTLPSVVSVYPTADWQEREAYDMFGVVFSGHPGLTRILMPDDWDGYPQRKDYPLGGIPVEYKGATVPPPEERRSYR